MIVVVRMVSVHCFSVKSPSSSLFPFLTLLPLSLLQVPPSVICLSASRPSFFFSVSFFIAFSSHLLVFISFLPFSLLPSFLCPYSLFSPSHSSFFSFILSFPFLLGLFSLFRSPLPPLLQSFLCLLFLLII